MTERYLLRTGWPGMLALWGGLAVQVGAISILAGVSGATNQSPGKATAAFFLVMIIYFVLDVAYVMSVELKLLEYFYDAYDMNCKPALSRPVLVGIFFLYAATANTFAIVLPALDAAGVNEPDYGSTAMRAFLLGWFAYGNLALVQAWSNDRYPLEIVGLIPVSGGAFSCASSVLTLYLCTLF